MGGRKYFSGGCGIPGVAGIKCQHALLFFTVKQKRNAV
jgi:hypothetical protein